MLKNPNRKNGSAIHANMLQPCSQDDVALSHASEERFVDLLNMWERVKGELLSPPPAMARDMVLWREMRIRHRRGDFRLTDDEWRATTRICDWVLRKKCELVGDKYEDVKIDWQR